LNTFRADGLAQKLRFRLSSSVAVISLLTAGLVSWQVLPAAGSQDDDCVFESGTGVATDPYRVANLTDLEMVRACHNSSSGLHFLMTADIDLTTVASWTPIGNRDYYFRGHFDGGGKTISRLKIVNPSQSEVGLFGVTQRSSIKNLNITGATVRQWIASDGNSSVEAGILVGRAYRGLNVSNVSISDSTLTGIRYLGAVAGEASSTDYVFSNVTVQNVKIQTPSTSPPSAQMIGLFVGHLYEHVSIFNSHVIDSSIDVAAAGPIYGISGFMVGCDEEMLVRDSSATGVEIKIRAGSHVENVAGFATGDPYLDDSCVFSDIESEVKISIEAGSYAQRIGGFADDSEEAVMTGISSRAEIEIKAVDYVREVGGALGQARTSYHTAIFKSEFDSTISVDVTGSSASYAERIGLAIGLARRITLTDVLIKGQVSVKVASGQQIRGVSNLIGEINSTDRDMRHIENVLIDAVPVAAQIGESTTGYSPRSKLIGGPLRTESGWQNDIWRFTSGVFWHGDKASGYAADEFGQPVSATDFSSRTFLEGQGFNFARNWCLTDGAARVAAVNPGCLASAASAAGGGSAGSGPAAYRGPTIELTSPIEAAVGQTVALTGERLSAISSVRIGGLFAESSLDASGLLSVVIPEGLAAGTYDLEIVSSDGILRIGSAVTVVSTSSATQPRVWTRAFADGTVKMYARDLLGAGKVQLYHNGVEVAWVRAIDETDPRLNVGADGSRDGIVRTRTLVPGKNVFEIWVAGERVRRAAYTG